MMLLGIFALYMGVCLGQFEQLQQLYFGSCPTGMQRTGSIRAGGRGRILQSSAATAGRVQEILDAVELKW
jgi:hypothetical protein